MDFSFTEAQTAVAELARRIFDERLAAPALKALEARPDRFDRALWGELAQAGLLGTAIAEAHGGSGQGFLELCALLEEAGAAACPLPLWEALVLGALPLARFGSPAQQARWLPRIAAGETVMTAALAEPDGYDPLDVATGARATAGAWTLHGVKTCVAAASLADRVLVPAATSEGGLGLFLVDPRGAGVTLQAQMATTGDTQHRVSLDGAPVGADDVLVDPARGKGALEWLVERATVALCAMELGIAERALRMTAAYTSTRQQFDRPIATFQAVAQRAADAYIDVESIRVTTWQAAWRLEREISASAEVDIAKIHAAEAGHRVVYAAQHLHGGMGFDRDYPLYRYYLRSKQIELTLGGASAHVASLGRRLAAQ